MFLHHLVINLYSTKQKKTTVELSVYSCFGNFLCNMKSNKNKEKYAYMAY